MSKKRLDVLVCERGLAESRQKAQALIMAGQIFVGGQKIDKAGFAVEESAEIELHGKALAYVSRGGLKLEKALQRFPLDLKGKICIDCGASTGGFTDCMLQNGAAKVYAVDVGYGQLAWSLRQDPRVICMERTNVRLWKRGCILHFFEADFAGPTRSAEAAGAGGVPGQTAIRGGQGKGGKERGRTRPGSTSGGVGAIFDSRI